MSDEEIRLRAELLIEKAKTLKLQKRITVLDAKLREALKEIRWNEIAHNFSNEYEAGTAMGYGLAGDIVEKALSEGGADEH